jgi:heptosyltransferase-2
MNNKTNINKENTKKFSFLIVRLSSIGDIVLTTHLIRCLRNTYQNAIIDFLLTDNFKEILKYNKRIDNLFYFNKNEFKSGETIIHSESSEIFDINKYDFVIDLQKNKYSRKLLSGVNCQVLKIDKQRLHKLSLVYFKKSIFKNFTVPINYLKSIETLNVPDDGLGLEFWLFGENEYHKLNQEGITKIDRIAIAPGAAHKTKQFPIEKFTGLLILLQGKYQCEFTILGGKDEIETGKKFQEKLDFSISDMTGKCSLQETAEIIDKSDLLITNDTGLMHIASARQTPIISFFGSSVREFGFEPFRCKHKIIETELWCRPCSHIGRNFCPLGHFKCMNQISISEILMEIDNLFSVL